MTRKHKLLCAAAFIGLAASAIGPQEVRAQSPCSILAYGVVPTVAQWQECFEAKQDYGSSSNGGITGAEVISALGYTPVNKAGDTMLGELTFLTSTATTAAFNIPPGTAPTSPNNGDFWTTSAGAFIHINGSTIQIGTGGSGATTITGACSGTSVGGTINLTCSTLAALASANNFTATNTFAGVQVARRTLLTNGTLSLSDNAVCINSNGSALTGTMPSGPTNGLTISVDDCEHNAATHNITVAANSGQTIGTGTTVTINANGGAITAVWNSTMLDWNLF